MKHLAFLSALMCDQRHSMDVPVNKSRLVVVVFIVSYNVLLLLLLTLLQPKY